MMMIKIEKHTRTLTHAKVREKREERRGEKREEGRENKGERIRERHGEENECRFDWLECFRKEMFESHSLALTL
jgi:hypothetical protein